VSVRGGVAASVVVPPPAPPAFFAVEGVLRLSLLYYPAVGGPASPLAISLGPAQALVAPPPAGVRVADLSASSAGADPCAGGRRPPVRSTDALPCLRVSGISVAAPLRLTFFGANLGAALGAGGASDIVLTSPGGVSARCEGATLVGALLTCAVSTPLNRGPLNISLGGGFAAASLPALGACAPGWEAPRDGAPCTPCPAEGARCAGGFDDATAAPGWWRTTAEDWAALGFPERGGGGGGAPPAFIACPRSELCLAENACVNGSVGWACTGCAAGSAAAAAAGGGCASCAESRAGNLAMGLAAGGAALAVALLGAVFVAQEGGVGGCRCGGAAAAAPPPPPAAAARLLAPSPAAPPRVALLPLARIAASLAHTLAVLSAFAPAAERANAGGAGSLWARDALFATIASFRLVRDLGSSSLAVACLLAPGPGLRAWAVVIAPAVGAGAAWAIAALAVGARAACGEPPRHPRKPPPGAPRVSPLSACVNSRAGAGAAFASLLCFSFLLPGTWVFAGVWLRCAGGEAGGYQLEEPSLSCRDPRYTAYAGALQGAWAYLAVPLGALAAACGGGPGAAPPALRAWAAGYAPTHVGAAWEALTLLRKAAMAATAAGLLGVAHPPSALLGVVAWLLGALFAQLAARPFERPALNALEGLGLLAGAAAALALLPRLQPGGAAPLAGLDAAAIGLLSLFSAAWAAVAADALLARSAGLARLAAAARRWKGAPPRAELPGSSAPAARGLVLRGFEDARAQTISNPLAAGASPPPQQQPAPAPAPAAAPSPMQAWHGAAVAAVHEEWRPTLGLSPLPPLAAAGSPPAGAFAASRIVRNTRVVEPLPAAAGTPLTPAQRAGAPAGDAAAATATVSPLAAVRGLAAFANSERFGNAPRPAGAAPEAQQQQPQLEAGAAAAAAAEALTPAPLSAAKAAEPDPWSHD